MSINPTTPEGRAELRRIATDGWMIRPHHVLAVIDALDDAECGIERQRGDLVIERRQVAALEAELARYRAEEQRVREWNALVNEGNVRCTRCDLRYSEREEYPCGDERNQDEHHYDADELAEARRRAMDGDA